MRFLILLYVSLLLMTNVVWTLTIPPSTDIRLVNGGNLCSGRVEVLYNGVWGTVCDDYWDLSDAAVVCRQLGCGYATEAKSNAYFGEGSGQIWMDDVQCAGDETTLTNCSSTPRGIHNCAHGEDAGVICQFGGTQTTATPSTSTQEISNTPISGFKDIRLVNGGNLCSGRVEVLYNGVWGTVCDDFWDLSDAAVVCRQLGCGVATEAKSNAYFGQGSGQIWMDDVQCAGNETTLTNCTATPRGTHNCVHGEDAGVICQNIRLVNGGNLCSGRVEVLYNGVWGTVCDDGWDLSDAAVVCRQLGCGNATEAKSDAYFGQGSGQIWMDDVQCTGNETTLTNCTATPRGIHNCGHNEDAGVICQIGRTQTTATPRTATQYILNTSISEFKDIRLVNGDNLCSGRVEVLYNGVWGTVCDDGWDLSDAAVVCRQLGCGVATEAKSNAYFGQGSGQIWMDDVQCTGNETTLTNCTATPRGTHNCVHGEDAGVICQNIRLVNGGNLCSGRVEVLYNGVWGTVCDDGWDLSDAAVVCRQLGCGNATEAKSNAYFGQGSGQIWMDDVQCTGNENTLTNCTATPRGTHDCGHHEDAGVICLFGRTQTTATPRTATQYILNTSISEFKDIRLVNGDNLCSGRVEVLYNGVWGTVCDDYWDLSDAAVVCQQLGCGVATEAKSNAYFGQGSGQIWMDDVQCTGNETKLTNCTATPRGTHNCVHGEDAGVICQIGRTQTTATPSTSTQEILNTTISGFNATQKISNTSIPGFKDIRLVNGGNLCSGRVEVLYNGVWGTVCDDFWDLSDAAVVCRQLGCGNATEAKSNAYFGQGSGQIWMDDVQCTGNETTLTNCSSRPIGTHDCGHHEDAGVICQFGRTQTTATPSTSTPEILNTTISGFKDIRLVNGGNLCSGRVEVLYNGVWGTVCDDYWDLSDAAVVCRQLGCGNATQATSNAYFGQGSGQIWMDDVQCTGNETTLTNCSSRPIGTHDCGHHEDAGVICQFVRSQTTATPSTSTQNISNTSISGFKDIRLVNGGNLCSGRVEVLYNGVWGTVCDDGWDLSDAAVVCRQLGCGVATEAKSNAYFGQGSGQIWMDDVQCTGNETTLTNCSSRPIGTHDCGHHEDAGVICQFGRTQTTATPSTSTPEIFNITISGFKDIRLVNGGNLCSGRVEVLYNGVWGTVCDDGWDLSDAAVVCRQLGCGVATEAKSNAYFGQGSEQIWMDDVQCTGNETTLTNCSSTPRGTHNCGHHEDAGVICQFGRTQTTTTASTSTPEIFNITISGFKDIRLVNGGNLCSGRVEVLYNGVWGTVCDDGWDLSDAAVVCRQLGCGVATEAKSNAYFGQGSGQIWMDDVQCTGNETTLTNCTATPRGTHDCGHHEDAGVICQFGRTQTTATPNTSTPETLNTTISGFKDIRLVNGGNLCSGRVEVLYNGVWGTVCDDGWDLSDAAVVCRQLGCGVATEAKSDAYFGQGSGQIWMDDVQCTGNETTLTNCSSRSIGTHDCGHHEDAGVICQFGWTTPAQSTVVRDSCSELNCTKDEWCGEQNGVYGCFCNGDHPTYDPDTFDVYETCESSSAFVSLSRCQLFEAGFPADLLHLNDPSCKGTVRNGRVEFGFDNNEHICGTSLMANGTHFIYENFIRGEPDLTSHEGPISRQRILSLHFSCIYQQTQSVSLDMHPLGSIVNRNLEGQGTYQVRMVPYLDAEFSKPFNGSVDVVVDEKIFVEVGVGGVDSHQFVSVIDGCWATPVNDPLSSLRWDLITGGCPNPHDNTVELLQNGNSTSSRFSFRMFVFTADSNKVYLHCNIHLCLLSQNDCSSHCNPGHQARRRRSVNFHDTASISMGPLVWSKGNSEVRGLQ
ncbi:scavenger receptor cysteine-rich domain-containing protein DMBT1 isoform X2 [Misgurnus anguillicaudatus]|uniref:scavenger receptor cysteine-rich domain-containing protein DMBT1 isoform X2 n=1 Tax=Misgurnus anguillicaudatus TaxID=75329 RepID=UPI003CCFBDEE